MTAAVFCGDRAYLGESRVLHRSGCIMDECTGVSTCRAETAEPATRDGHRIREHDREQNNIRPAYPAHRAPQIIGAPLTSICLPGDETPIGHRTLTALPQRLFHQVQTPPECNIREGRERIEQQSKEFSHRKAIVDTKNDADDKTNRPN